MENLTPQTIDKIVELGTANIKEVEHPKGGKAVILPEGFHVEHLPPIDPSLTHIKQRVSLLDTMSLVAYVNRFKAEGEKTTLFADYQKPVIEARFDYHEPGKPDYGEHIASFQPPWSEQWERWRAINEKALPQAQFADFIEENMQDIVTPSGAVFLDLVTNLHAKKNVTFNSGIRLQDGSNQLTYDEQIEARGKGTMVVPSEFEIGLPVFFGGAPYKVKCFLRYRIAEGLVFIIKINRKLFIEQTAFADITKEIAEKTGITPLNGRA